eukprot:gene5119-6372_t
MTNKSKNFVNLRSTQSVHFFSGLTLAVFIGFHLFNQLYSIYGPAAHIELMTSLRKVYRNPIIETVLLLSVVTQVVSGIRLAYYKRYLNTTVKKVQVYSGLYLAFFLIVHVAAVLAGRYALHLDTNFYFAATAINYVPKIFIPYYFTAVVCVALHFASMNYLKLRSKLVAYTIVFSGLVMAYYIISGYTDNFKWRQVPTQYLFFLNK